MARAWHIRRDEGSLANRAASRRGLRAAGPFTIKQCNRVADAWSVVCGPSFGSHLPPPPGFSLSSNDLSHYYLLAARPPPLSLSFVSLHSFLLACMPIEPDSAPATLGLDPRRRRCSFIPRSFSLTRARDSAPGDSFARAPTALELRSFYFH